MDITRDQYKYELTAYIGIYACCIINVHQVFLFERAHTGTGWRQ